MYKKYINLGKAAVEIEDHEALQELYKDLHNGGQNNEYQINIEYIFLQLFYHACKLERKGTILYLYNFYKTAISDSDKIALRQSFTYGKYLMKTNTLKEWYAKTILVNQKK